MNIPGLSSITKLADVGSAMKDIVNGLLPKQLGVVGDVAGAVVDFKSGNVVGAVQHGIEALRDLPQAAKGLQQGAMGHGHVGFLNRRPALEPSPPPLLSRAGKPFDWGALLQAIKALTAALNAHGTAATGKPAAATDKPAAATDKPAAAADKPAASDAAHAAAPGSTGSTARNETAVATRDGNGVSVSPRRASSTATTTVTVRTTTVETSPWVGEPRTPAPAKPADTSPASGASASSWTNGASTPAASTPAASASSGQTISSLSQLQSMSDAAIRDAVIHGRISPEIAKDQGAMMALQQRMNAISEMNNLMTAMMRAMHDMQMAIIQNIRI
jgi:hypothetical protein